MSHGKLSYKMSGDGRRLVYELQINCKFQYHLGSSRWNTNIFTRSLLLLSGYLVVCFRMVFFRVYLKPEPRPYWPPFAVLFQFSIKPPPISTKLTRDKFSLPKLLLLSPCCRLLLRNNET